MKRMRSLTSLIFALVACQFSASCKMSAWRTPRHSIVTGERKIPISELPMGREVFMAAVMSSPLIMIKLKDGRRRGARFCSGVLIAGKGDLPRVLTTQHCFRQTSAEETPDIIRDACANTVVYFDTDNKQEGKDGIVPKLERTCKRGSLRTSFEGDIAVFTLSAALPSSYTATEIWQDAEFPANRKVFAIYYPSNPSAVKGTKPVIVEGGFNGTVPPKLMNIANCHIERRIPANLHQSSQLQHAAHKLPYAVVHNCVLVKASGAGLIDMETGKLLALHFGHMAAGEVRVNTATHAMHLRQFLAGEKLTLP